MLLSFVTSTYKSNKIKHMAHTASLWSFWKSSDFMMKLKTPSPLYNYFLEKKGVNCVSLDTSWSYNLRVWIQRAISARDTYQPILTMAEKQRASYLPFYMKKLMQHFDNSYQQFTHPDSYWPATCVSYYAVPMWLLQVAVLLRVRWQKVGGIWMCVLDNSITVRQWTRKLVILF